MGGDFDETWVRSAIAASFRFIRTHWVAQGGRIRVLLLTGRNPREAIMQSRCDCLIFVLAPGGGGLPSHFARPARLRLIFKDLAQLMRRAARHGSL